MPYAMDKSGGTPLTVAPGASPPGALRPEYRRSQPSQKASRRACFLVGPRTRCPRRRDGLGLGGGESDTVERCEPLGERGAALVGELDDELDDELDAGIGDSACVVVRQAGDKPKAWCVIRRAVVAVAHGFSLGCAATPSQTRYQTALQPE